MFPCYFGIPKHQESLIIIMTDKWCSVIEGVFKYNSFQGELSHYFKKKKIKAA